MSTAPIESLTTAERRRLVAFGLLRALATTVLVVAAYYLLPLDNLAGISLGVALAVGLLALTAGVTYQVERSSGIRTQPSAQSRHSPSPCRCSSFSSPPRTS